MIFVQLAELKRCHKEIVAEQQPTPQQQQPPGSFPQLRLDSIEPPVDVSLAGDTRFLSLLDSSAYVQTQVDRDRVQHADSRGPRPSLGSGGLFHSPPQSPDRRAAFAAEAQPVVLIDRCPVFGTWDVPLLAVDQSLAADSLLIYPVARGGFLNNQYSSDYLAGTSFIPYSPSSHRPKAARSAGDSVI